MDPMNEPAKFEVRSRGIGRKLITENSSGRENWRKKTRGKPGMQLLGSWQKDKLTPKWPNWSELLTYLHRLNSSCSKRSIGRRVVSIWHDHWQFLSRHSNPHSSLLNLLSVYLAMSSLVFQVSFCRLLESIPKLESQTN